MTLNGVMTLTLRYFTEFGSFRGALHKSAGLRVRCRRKQSSRSLSHLLMSFLYIPRSVKVYDPTSLFSLLVVMHKWYIDLKVRNGEDEGGVFILNSKCSSGYDKAISISH